VDFNLSVDFKVSMLNRYPAVFKLPEKELSNIISTNKVCNREVKKKSPSTEFNYGHTVKYLITLPINLKREFICRLTVCNTHNNYSLAELSFSRMTL